MGRADQRHTPAERRAGRPIGVGLGILAVAAVGLGWWLWPAGSAHPADPAAESVRSTDPGPAQTGPRIGRAPADPRADPLGWGPGSGEGPDAAAGTSGTAEQALAALAPRLQDHLAELDVRPDEPLDPARFGPLIGEQRRLVDAYRGLSGAGDLRVAADAARAEAELHDAFGAWLDEVAGRIPHNPELVDDLQTLADGRYADAEQGWELADEIESAGRR